MFQIITSSLHYENTYVTIVMICKLIWILGGSAWKVYSYVCAGATYRPGVQAFS